MPCEGRSILRLDHLLSQNLCPQCCDACDGRGHGQTRDTSCCRPSSPSKPIYTAPAELFAKRCRPRPPLQQNYSQHQATTILASQQSEQLWTPARAVTCRYNPSQVTDDPQPAQCKATLSVVQQAALITIRYTADHVRVANVYGACRSSFHGAALGQAMFPDSQLLSLVAGAGVWGGPVEALSPELHEQGPRFGRASSDHAGHGHDPQY